MSKEWNKIKTNQKWCNKEKKSCEVNNNKKKDQLFHRAQCKLAVFLTLCLKEEELKIPWQSTHKGGWGCKRCCCPDGLVGEVVIEDNSLWTAAEGPVQLFLQTLLTHHCTHNNEKQSACSDSFLKLTLSKWKCGYWAKVDVRVLWQQTYRWHFRIRDVRSADGRKGRNSLRP